VVPPEDGLDEACMLKKTSTRNRTEAESRRRNSAATVAERTMSRTQVNPYGTFSLDLAKRLALDPGEAAA
jgi:hypothetical protein